MLMNLVTKVRFRRQHDTLLRAKLLSVNQLQKSKIKTKRITTLHQEITTKM